VAIALLGSVYPIVRLRSTDVVALLRGDDPVRRGARHSFHLFSTLLLVVVVPLAFFRVVPVVGAAERPLVATLLFGLVVLGLLIGVPLLLPRLIARASAALARGIARRSLFVARIAGRNLEESAGRVGASISAMALVTAAFVGLKGMTASLAGETEVWGETALSDRILVEHLPDASLPELRALLHAQPGVLGVEAGEARVFPSFLLLGQPVVELDRHGPLADPALARAFHDEQGIVLSQRLARQRGLGAGDQVLVNTSGHGVQSFRVLAVSDAYGYFFHPDERAYGVIDERYLVRYFCTDVASSSSIAVKLAPGASPEPAVRALEERFPDAHPKVYDGAGLVRIMLRDLTVDFLVFDVILLLTAILSAVGVLNGQLLAAIERQKELGVLRALGAVQGQVGAIVLVEALVIGCLGGALGALVGLGLTPVLVSALGVLSGLDLPLRSGGAWVPFAFLAAVALSVAAALYPVLAIRRFDAVRAVRTG
jgi:putative ABC transport system permease protein